jgi:transcriptional regulator with XRE-family HTH domain
MGLSQCALGSAVGLTLQQIQKYEKGHNSMKSTRLYELARRLHVPVAYFFEELDADDAPIPVATLEQVAYGYHAASECESLELIKAFSRINDLALRTRIAHVVRAIAKCR